MNKMSESFLVQTSLDYDMPLYEVKRIAKLYPKNFYEMLEYFIKERKK
jgi:hypothetical protein